MLFGALCQTSQAQSILIESSDAVLASANGVAADDITVDYTVTQDTSSKLYTYTYDFSNPTSTALIESFNVGFDATPANAATDISGTQTGTGRAVVPQNNGPVGVTWLLFVQPSQSANLSFESTDAPILGNGNAGGSDTESESAAPWASSPDGTQLAVPETTSIVPEPGITALIAAGLLMLALRPNLVFKKA